MDNLFTKLAFVKGLINLSKTAPVFANNNLVITLLSADAAGAKAKFEEWNIQYTNIVEEEFLIKLSSIDPPTVVFFKELQFRQGVEKFIQEDGSIKSNIAIADYQDSFLVYHYLTGNTFINSVLDSKNFLVENAVSYYSLLRHLKDKTFSDYVNVIDKEIVLYSSTKGIKRIQIPDFLPDFDSNKSIKHDCNTFVSKLQSSDFKIYFKNQLFDFNNTESSTALKDIALSLGTIIQEADNNLQLYLKNFSFEKLKNDLQKEKEKYFSSLREILGKNLSQIVAIPVSFAASVFATYKVADGFVLFIILLSFILYSVFTYYLQSLYLNDVKEIEVSFKKDFDKVSEKSGLPKSEIDLEKAKIERRITDIRQVIVRFRYLLIALTIVFTLFIAYQLLSIWAGITFCKLLSGLLFAGGRCG